MRVLLMGPPGAGKGTQGSRLAENAEVTMISTGELFRAHVRDRTGLGRQISAILDSGVYVPDTITNAMMRERLAEPDATGGFVLDGYPRTLHQVDELDRMLAESGVGLSAVVELTVSDAEVLDRLLIRGDHAGRSDDSPEIVKRRLAIYHEQTAPLRDKYEKRGLVIKIDGSCSPDEVERLIAAAVRSAEPVHP